MTVTDDTARLTRVGREAQTALELSRDYVSAALTLTDGHERVRLAIRARQGARHYGLGSIAERTLFLAGLFYNPDPEHAALDTRQGLSGTEERHLAALVCHLFEAPDAKTLTTMIFGDATRPTGPHQTAWGRDLNYRWL